MQYMGGKARIRPQLVAFLQSVRRPGQIYFEPFVGGLNIFAYMPGPRVAYDANPHLITLYKAIQTGWVPPDEVSEETYQAVRARMDVNDPMTAFCGFGCSFAGKWFGGYARRYDGYGHFAVRTKRSLLKGFPYDALFRARSYEDWVPKPALVYCDPPYVGTTAYTGATPFNHAHFWATMRAWSQAPGVEVYVSEYQAPADFVCVKEFQSRLSLRTTAHGNEARIERLFQYRP